VISNKEVTAAGLHFFTRVGGKGEIFRKEIKEGSLDRKKKELLE